MDSGDGGGKIVRISTNVGEMAWMENKRIIFVIYCLSLRWL